MEAKVFYRDEMLDEDHCYSTVERLLQDDSRPLITAVVYEVDEYGTPMMDRVLATWNGFVRKELTDSQKKQLMSVALENYTERTPAEVVESEGKWENLWAEYTPYHPIG